MAASAAERVAALTEEIATTIGRRVDRVVGEISEGAGFDSIQNPAAEVLGTVAAFRRIVAELEVAEREASALHAALLQLEARGADDDTVRAAERRSEVAGVARDELLSNLERLAAAIKSGRVRSR